VLPGGGSPRLLLEVPVAHKAIVFYLALEANYLVFICLCPCKTILTVFILFVALGFELRAWHLQNRYSTA
jgi:hypothetical protein